MKIRIHFREILDDGTVSAPSWEDIIIYDKILDNPKTIHTYIEKIHEDKSPL